MKKMYLLIIAAVVSFFLPFSAHAQVKARISTTQSTLDSLCGTHNIKLVFTCQAQMYLVDFSETSPQAPEVVFGQGSYYGGLSWDNRYLNTGWEGGPNGFILTCRTHQACRILRIPCVA